jgi:soluble lytic murein transglycosylase-like protein
MLSGLLLITGLISRSDAATYDSQRDAFLEAVAMVETNGNPRAVGSLGERGLYQFTRTTWKQHTKRSHYAAHDPHYSTEIARKHYDWLYENLSEKGFPPSPYWLAVAWNSGLKRTTSGRFPSVSRRYAERVTNLVFDSQRQLLAMNQVRGR